MDLARNALLSRQIQLKYLLDESQAEDVRSELQKVCVCVVRERTRRRREQETSLRPRGSVCVCEREREGKRRGRGEGESSCLQKVCV